jgi:uncharacterized protein
MRLAKTRSGRAFAAGVVHQAAHAPFQGFNRAKAAVIEAAIVVSRLGMLPREKIEQEVAYLQIAVGKTAGPDEQEAWGWLMEKIRADAPRNSGRPPPKVVEKPRSS